MGTFAHMEGADHETLKVELMSRDAMQTSKIEGELLDRESVQASIRRLLGVESIPGKVRPAEFAIAEVTVSVYRTFDTPLTHKQLHEWHRMLTSTRHDLTDAGRYRTHSEPIQIVSGPLARPQVHFEAPPSQRVQAEMDEFLKWFERSHPTGSQPLPALTRAGIAHLYFESIHPYEDGNGRLGRAVAEKVLSQAIGYPGLVMLSDAIEKRRKEYYDQLARASLQNDIHEWLEWFAGIILSAQTYSYEFLAFILEKSRTMNRFRHVLNTRQEKALLRIFKEGPEGFEGGLSARNYQRITGASAATATRDLNELVEAGVLKKTGNLKSTRYWLKRMNSEDEPDSGVC